MRKITFVVVGLLLCAPLVFSAIALAGCSEYDQALDGKAMSVKIAPAKDIRLRKFPMAIQCWTFRKYSFLEALEKAKALGIDFVQPYPGQALSPDKPEVVFDHNLSEEHIQWVRTQLRRLGQSLVAYGVVNFENTEQEMRQIFDFAKKLGIRTIVTEPGFDEFALLERMVKEYNVNIAIHNHPTPSKYARPETILERVEGWDRRIGACVDTGHWMRSGVNPLQGLRLLEGRIIDVHLKDLDVFGAKDAQDVPFGQGEAEVDAILAELTRQNFRGYLTVEHEREAEALDPEQAIKKGIEYIKNITYYEGYEEILKWQNGTFSKHGWNHYGPGYFVLDEQTGVLKSQGGMGLLWYSEKKYRDFVLELDFKCSQANTNSGIFLRIPFVPTSDDYIYHAFEVQIYDIGDGIHKTGAVYDAEAPKSDAFKPSGEWNHTKITFQDSRIQVELNGTVVVDWEAEPRGKVKDFAAEGYVGLQNHDSISPVYFRNIFVKEL